MPSGAVEQQHGVGTRGDVARDFVEMELHHVGVGVGQRQRRADPARRADGAEQIGVVVTLVGWLARPRSAPGPLPHEAVLLADAASSLHEGSAVNYAFCMQSSELG